MDCQENLRDVLNVWNSKPTIHPKLVTMSIENDDEVKKPFALPEVRLWSLKHIYNRNNQAVFDPFDVWRNFTVSFIFQLILFDIYYFCFKIDFKRVLKPKIISIFFFLFHFVLDLIFSLMDIISSKSIVSFDEFFVKHINLIFEEWVHSHTYKESQLSFSVVM